MQHSTIPRSLAGIGLLSVLLACAADPDTAPRAEAEAAGPGAGASGAGRGSLAGESAVTTGSAGTTSTVPGGAGATGSLDAGSGDEMPTATTQNDVGAGGGGQPSPEFALRLSAADAAECPLTTDGRSLRVRVENTGQGLAPAAEVLLSTEDTPYTAVTAVPALAAGEAFELELPRAPVAGFRERWAYRVDLDGGTAGDQVLQGVCENPLRQRARLGMEVLQTWYDEGVGLYRNGENDQHEWWRGANMLEVAADYARELGDATYLDSFSNTFEKHRGGQFINEYYDDEGWWALAFLRVYDLTLDGKYLDGARVLFEDIAASWDDNHCGGGVYWKKETDAKTAIANELFFVLAARLHHRAVDAQDRALYLDWAQRTWSWFEQSGLIRDGQVIDGLDFDTCGPGWEATFTYNQGVILGGLVELWRSTRDDALLDTALLIADTNIERQTTDEGIFIEANCYPNCGGGDGVMFKGPFVRNVALLYEVRPEPRLREFLLRQGDAIWERNRNQDNQFGQFWPGPVGAVGAAQQAVALDAIVGAVRVANMNLAIGANATGPGGCAESEGPGRAIDGNGRSKWCAPGAGGQVLTIELPAAQEITGFIVKHASSQGEDEAFNTHDFELEVSSDGNSWEQVAAIANNTTGITEHYVPAVVASHVRLHVTQAEREAGGGAARIFELEVLGVERRQP